MGNFRLKEIGLSSNAFDELLRKWPSRRRDTDNIELYMRGYKDKGLFYHGFLGNAEYYVCTSVALVGFIDINKITSKTYYQYVVRRLDARDDTSVDDARIECEVNGWQAWQWLMRTIRAYYSEAEIDAARKEHWVDEADREQNKQIHYYSSAFDCIDTLRGKVIQIHNCQAYDIHSAYASRLAQIFPKAAHEIQRMYTMRKEHPEYKQYFNYAVGFMRSKCMDGKIFDKWHGVNNWIVSRITMQMRDAIEKCDGTLVYANTDGFVVADAARKLDTSDKMGDFGLEHEGDVWYYRHCGNTTYRLYLIGNKYKGQAIPINARENIDLPRGIVIDARVVRECNVNTYHDIQSLQKEVIEYNGKR